jgi:hypothetical protein
MAVYDALIAGRTQQGRKLLITLQQASRHTEDGIGPLCPRL